MRLPPRHGPRSKGGTGQRKGSPRASLPPQMAPQRRLWKTCVAKHEPARARPARRLRQALALPGGYDLSVLLCNPGPASSSPSLSSWCKAKLRRPQSPGGFAPGLSSFEGVNANRLLHPLAYASVPMPHASHNLLAKLYAVIQAMLSPVTAEGNRSVVCPRPCWKQADLCCIFTKAVSHLILKVTCNSCFSFPK